MRLDRAFVRKKRPHNWIEGVERDKWGKIIRTCGVACCPYKTGKPDQLKNHKAAKHGINVVWCSCDQDNCDYKAKQASSVKNHKQDIHNIDVGWH
ncbi:hypothetical protein TrLO_g8197 [Triparma laevis f. longispina]|uniref:C2H2-type domain-containing protein n=1 Tax=Triparma laevis f. longispina TaxID=1714387 RepID=A0A9W7DR03_9STRA|nr:hypothetical protein TrLO_g8197 [Triparma laevis f. longispina]